VSRVTYEDEKGIERVVIIDYKECRLKTNGKCYNNYDWRKLGKVCHGCKEGDNWRERR